MLFAPYILMAAQLAWAAPGADIAASWYVSWHSTDFPLNNVSWSKYTTVIYAFA
jgi:chitinase